MDNGLFAKAIKACACKNVAWLKWVCGIDILKPNKMGTFPVFQKEIMTHAILLMGPKTKEYSFSNFMRLLKLKCSVF